MNARDAVTCETRVGQSNIDRDVYFAFFLYEQCTMFCLSFYDLY